ncbi:DUF5320 domain-containing protein [Aminiphilus circumscriptus]|jgi:hypothetical protein|uniref:DUF5320 domain-containing protein n=1 Tax=Aminiphilus circumscriptus TaxID=290732 RepID=UPI0012F985A3|nr:DUF5320 domain-containing protein [Aminiphilus circumscriptus]
MPGRNGTGPRGMGPATGWGCGPCGMGFRRGFCRGGAFRAQGGWGGGMPLSQWVPSSEVERNALEQEAEYLEQRLNQVRSRMASYGKTEE